MAKLGQLLGLTPLETFQLTDFQANYLAIAVGDSLMRDALETPAALSPKMRATVRSRTARITRSFRSENSASAGVIGPPPEE
jgi:hypothetical protein